MFIYAVVMMFTYDEKYKFSMYFVLYTGYTKDVIKYRRNYSIFC